MRAMTFNRESWALEPAGHFSTHICKNMPKLEYTLQKIGSHRRIFHTLMIKTRVILDKEPGFRNYILPEILDSANRPLFIAGGCIDNRLKRYKKVIGKL
jgi:hypothetical protein